MESINVSELVERLGSDEDAVRKMAVFKLQSNIGDPSFADIFILEGGLAKLRHLVLNASGNTLAYSLTSFSRLLEVDKGWDYVSQDVVERVVELVVTHPLVNILRGAMSILVYIVSHPYTTSSGISQPDAFGFRALKPAIAIYPEFLEMLVSRLSSADHALCANALQLINSLMREAITNDSETEWPKFIKRIQDLGVIQAVYTLMQGSALQDLSPPLLDFQALTKVLLKKWRDLPVDLERPDHRRALKSIHAASNPPERVPTPTELEEDTTKKKTHNPEKWRRLGFETETPAFEFDDVGYLGMTDLTDYVRKHGDAFQKLLLEQSTRPADNRCPIARASLAVTAILFEHFDIEKADPDDAKSHLAFESKTNFDKLFKPLILQWSVMHVAGLEAFFRLWNSTGALLEDFNKIYDLVRILIEAVVGPASRTRNVQDVQADIADYQLGKLRQLQMELLELTHEDAWDVHLRQIKDELGHEALHFVKEQRIRCLLDGSWFPNNGVNEEVNGLGTKHDVLSGDQASFRYVKLSQNRRHLHYADFATRGEGDLDVDDLTEKIDLQTVTSVTSNVTAASATSSTATLKHNQTPQQPSTKITIHGYVPSNSRPTTPKLANGFSNHNRTLSNGTKPSHNHTHSSHRREKEITLLTLHPQTQSLASEWLDGLLMLLNQQPITNETSKLINMIKDYGLKIRLLNVRFDDIDFAAGAAPELPSREGLDDDYYYDIFGG